MKIEEINSMLLEELLGISKKRLRYIFEGKNLDEESSTDEDKPVDVISLDDISDDDFVVISDDDSVRNMKKNRKKIKQEPKDKSKKIKKEKPEKDKYKGKEKQSTSDKEPMGEENLMSVLELLELQARARAIRSQLDLENKRKKEEQERLEREKTHMTQGDEQDDEEEIIIEVPKEVEIVITSSDSEKEEGKIKVITSKNDNVSDNLTSVNLFETKKDKNSNGTRKECPQGSVTTNLQIENSKNDKSKNLVNDKNNIEKSLLEGDSSNSKEQGKCKEKEEGEVSESESHKQQILGRRVELANTSNSTNEPDDNGEESIYSSGSTSDSSDNLQIILLREKRRKKRCLEKLPLSKSSKPSVDSGKDTEGSLHNNDTNCLNLYSEHVSQDEQNEDNQFKKNISKLDVVIADFMQTQPPLVGNTDNILKLDKLEEAKMNEDKVKQGKEKRLKKLKNKLQSYKQDVEIESSVTILENIVIKPKAVEDVKSKERVAEDHDDLVINVDQDDLDCMICD